MTDKEGKEFANRVFAMTEKHPALQLFLRSVKVESAEAGIHQKEYWKLYQTMTFDLLGKYIDDFEALP